MKNLFIIIFSIISIQNIVAQDSGIQLYSTIEYEKEAEQEETKKNSLSLGFIYSPRAFTTFEESERPFTVDQAFYGLPTFVFDKWSLAPFYNFGGHRTGVFVGRAISESEGVYVFGDQSLNENFGAYGLGLTTALHQNIAQGFIEIGGTRGSDPEPALLIGLYIPFSREVKRW